MWFLNILAHSNVLCLVDEVVEEAKDEEEEEEEVVDEEEVKDEEEEEANNSAVDTLVMRSVRQMPWVKVSMVKD
jgi:CO dehydrogenase/acetyl-CoA synthase beta subunit